MLKITLVISESSPNAHNWGAVVSDVTFNSFTRNFNYLRKHSSIKIQAKNTNQQQTTDVILHHGSKSKINQSADDIRHIEKMRSWECVQNILEQILHKNDDRGFVKCKVHRVRSHGSENQERRFYHLFDVAAIFSAFPEDKGGHLEAYHSNRSILKC